MAKFLIIGAGVIGSVYGGLLAKAGNDITFLAKGKRLAELQKNGLTLKWLNKDAEDGIKQFRLIDNLPKNEIFDFILVTVRKENLGSVYPALKSNSSSNIVFMVNNPDGSSEYTKYLDKEKIILGFPGAGGEIKNGKVNCHVVSGLIQPTTIGEIHHLKSARLSKLKELLQSAGFPTEINSNMDLWLINHLAMVCPLANAIYADGGNNYTVSKNKVVLRKTAGALKEAFRFLKQTNRKINPPKFNFFIYCPTGLLAFLLKFIYNTKWAKTVICMHALNAKQEMKLLNAGFLDLTNHQNKRLPVFKELASFNQ
ncbi:MAG: ketopantoate reductase family protein [Bacteroidales bacterium]|nr:ketopantoate reductase family protein [Bacteroidales bacterium]